ncbi:hypothetical protein [Rhizobium sp. LjRoot258]|uniref:hypothetical protein n=1 Tax=Rhizobium sp. LjRoot258 TaxID=3342299 RepID=UPI003ECE7705
MAIDGLSWESDQYELERHLPGINLFSLGAEKDERLFSQANRAALAQAARDKRLASPSHARLYFTLVAPSDGVSDLDIAHLLEAAGKGRAAVAALLVELDGYKGDAGASKAERMLDQLRYTPHETLETWPIETLIAGMVDAADDLARDTGSNEWGRPHIWYLMKALLRQLKAALPQDRYDTAITSAFETGASLGFLTEVLRGETFGHGYFGDRASPHDRLTSSEGFESIRLKMLDRYSALGVDEVVAHAYATPMVYAWSQAGGRVDLIQRVAARASSETWLLSFIQTLYGPRSTLSFDALATFFPSPVAVVRQVYALAGPDNPAAQDIIRSIQANSHASDGDFDAVLSAWQARETATQAAPGQGASDCGETG